MELRDKAREGEFRDQLEDLLVLLKSFGPTCTDLGEMTQVVETAVGNEENPPNYAMVRVLMAVVGRGGVQKERAANVQRRTP